MKLDKEKFNQLKQLDRIEFRQKYRNINEGGVSLDLHVWGLLIIGSIFGTVGLVSGRIPLLNLSIALFKVAFIVLVISLGLNLIDFIFKTIRTKKLKEEYFSVEVKKK